MTRAHYGTLWTAIGTILVFYTLNAWIATQGGQPLFDVNLIEARAELSGFFAIPLCAALLALLSEIGLRYARRSEDAARWHDRMPVVGLTGLNTASREGRAYQCFFLFAFILVPILGLVHFLNKTNRLVVFDRRSCEQVSAFALPAEPLRWSTWNDGYRIGVAIPDPCGRAPGSVTWLPVIEPLIFGLLIALAFWRSATFLVAIFRPSAAGRGAD